VKRFAVVLALLALLVACGDATPERAQPRRAVPASSPDDDDAAAVRARLEEIDALVSTWHESEDLRGAHAAAEAAANLVVGPNGPGYGDRDGDGEIAGANDEGLLPGSDGTPAGLASPLATDECVARDVLAGTTTDPAAAWAQLDDVLAAWTPSSNTMPQLASHPMRLVGWATLALRADSLDDAHEFAGHAALHVHVAQDALDC